MAGSKCLTVNLNDNPQLSYQPGGADDIGPTGQCQPDKRAQPFCCVPLSEKLVTYGPVGATTKRMTRRPLTKASVGSWMPAAASAASLIGPNSWAVVPVAT